MRFLIIGYLQVTFVRLLRSKVPISCRYGTYALSICFNGLDADRLEMSRPKVVIIERGNTECHMGCSQVGLFRAYWSWVVSWFGPYLIKFK